MGKIFKDLIVLQAEVALLPEGGEFYGVRKALADLVDSVLSLPEYEDVEVTQDSANIIKVEIPYGSVKMSSPEQHKTKQDLNIGNKVRTGVVTSQVVEYTLPDGETVPLIIITDEDMLTWVTYPTNHIFHDNGTIEPHYVLFNMEYLEVANMFRSTLRDRVTKAYGGKSRLYGGRSEAEYWRQMKQNKGSSAFRFVDAAGEVWYTTKGKSGEFSVVLYEFENSALEAREYIEHVAKVFKNHELAQKPSYISVENLNDKVKSGEYEVVRQNTFNCDDGRNFQVATVSLKGQPTGVYSYVAMANRKRGSESVLSDRVYAKITEAINYGGYLNGNR